MVALADFCAGEAAFVSQKTTIEYCRARAGINWDKLFRETAFGEALERCRWDAYAAALGDIAETCQIFLRHNAALAAAGPTPLAGAAGAALNRYPPPPPLPSWQAEIEAIEVRLARALLARPRPVHEVGHVAAARIFDALPIHSRLRGHDRQLVSNNIRVNLCQVYARMERQLDARALDACVTVS